MFKYLVIIIALVLPAPAAMAGKADVLVAEATKSGDSWNIAIVHRKTC